MFEVKQIKGNTYFFEAFSHVGIYKTGNGKVILIDSAEHKRMVRTLSRYFDSENLQIDTIINTHSHMDHICGNNTFYDKYGCRILSTEKEKPFIYYTDLESSFYYAGIDTDKSRNPFFMSDASVAEVINKSNLPEGFEIIPLPGHSFEMIGIRTPDDVVFLADSVLSEKTWQDFKVPFFHDVNASIETLEKIKELEAFIFVPSHTEPMKDITALADYNIERLNHLKEETYRLCDSRGFDDIFSSLMEALEITPRTEKYPSYAAMVRNVMQALVDDGKICGVMENGRFIYKKSKI